MSPLIDVPDHPELPRLAALDGLRGVAVVVLVLGHAGVGALPGGDVATSTLLAVSGFLLASTFLTTLLDDPDTPVVELLLNRVRRIVPSLLVGVGAAVLYGLVAADDVQLAALRADGLATLAQVANWRYLVDGVDPAAAFEARALSPPLLGLWSLSLLVQLSALLAVLTRALSLGEEAGRRALAVALALAVVAMTVLAVIAEPGEAYFGTHTRGAELAAGALTGAIVFDRRTARALAAPGQVRTTAAWTGLAAFLALSVGWVLLDAGDRILYDGGFAVAGVLSAAVVVGAIAPAGPLHAVLSWGPLRLVGLASFAIYALHWPLLVWLSSDRIGLDPTPAAAVGAAVAVAAGLAVHLVVERPLRHGRLPFGLRGWQIGPPVALALVVGLLLLPRAENPASYDVVGYPERQEVKGGPEGG